MANEYGIGDLGLFSGGAGTASTGTGQSSLAQGNVGATLDLSSLQSIQGHTIVDGLSAQEALNFASLIADTAQKSNAQGVSQQKSSSSGTTKTLLIAGGGLVLAVLAFFAIKK